MPKQNHSTFLYFAYGSNLLSSRIRLSNPSANVKTIGLLKDYYLDFNLQSKHWQGCVATVTPKTGTEVWGVVWELHQDDLNNLDNQEGVKQGIYKVIFVTVETPSGEKLTCRTYQLTWPLETDRRPSSVYKDVILSGAQENHLPSAYIKQLEDIKDNGRIGPVIVEGINGNQLVFKGREK